MLYSLLTFLLLFISSIAYADICNHELLLSGAWKHEKSGDVYVLEAGGDMKCKNEKRHREECDYVYTSDFIGIPESWELTDSNKIIITFDTGVFKSETVEYDCSFNPSQKKLRLGEVIFVKTIKPDS